MCWRGKKNLRFLPVLTDLHCKLHCSLLVLHYKLPSEGENQMAKYQMIISSPDRRDRVAAVVSGDAHAERIVSDYGSDWADLGLSYRLQIIKRAQC